MTQHTVRIWDLPTRIFHWALAACIVALVITANVGGNAMVWHFRLGYTVLALLVFRLVWGLVGGRWSRFSAFLYSPARLLRYLRGMPHPEEASGTARWARCRCSFCWPCWPPRWAPAC